MEIKKIIAEQFACGNSAAIFNGGYKDKFERAVKTIFERLPEKAECFIDKSDNSGYNLISIEGREMGVHMYVDNNGNVQVQVYTCYLETQEETAA